MPNFKEFCRPEDDKKSLSKEAFGNEYSVMCEVTPNVQSISSMGPVKI